MAYSSACLCISKLPVSAIQNPSDYFMSIAFDLEGVGNMAALQSRRWASDKCTAFVNHMAITTYGDRRSAQ
jgi:hypothetical protein